MLITVLRPPPRCMAGHYKHAGARSSSQKASSALLEDRDTRGAPSRSWGHDAECTESPPAAKLDGAHALRLAAGARRGLLQLCSWNLEREFGGCTMELAACTPKISLAEQTAGMRSRRGLEAASRSPLPRCLLSCSRPSPGDEKLMNSFPLHPQKLCQLPFSPHLRLVRCFLWSRGRND